MGNEQTVYDMVGGDDAFRKLVDYFYQFVSEDDQLRHMFPPDLEPGKQWQFLFLTQFFGGPVHIVRSGDIHACGCGITPFKLTSTRVTVGSLICVGQ